MSCCNGKCGCGSNCGCGSGCNGCGMYPDLSSEESYSASETLIVGLAPPAKALFGSEGFSGAENGCKCGANCTCDPCTCK